MNNFEITFDSSVTGYWGWDWMLHLFFGGILLLGLSFLITALRKSKKEGTVEVALGLTGLGAVFLSAVFLISNLFLYFFILPEEARDDAVRRALIEEGFDTIEPTGYSGYGPADQWVLGKGDDISTYEAIYLRLEGDDEMHFYETR